MAEQNNPLRGIGLFEKSLKYIKANLDKWDQSEGVGPCRCLIGWARYFSGIGPGRLDVVAITFGINEDTILWIYDPVRTIADFNKFLRLWKAGHNPDDLIVSSELVEPKRKRKVKR
mgnify:CR=1 FL=1